MFKKMEHRADLHNFSEVGVEIVNAKKVRNEKDFFNSPSFSHEIPFVKK